MLTTVIGSYPLSYDELGKQAIIRSVRDQMDAGIHLVSDGQTRYDMVEYYARAIEGYRYDAKSFIVGKIGKGNPQTLLDDLRIARAATPHVKGIITGPVTLVFSSEINGYYKGYRDAEVYLDTARALLAIAQALEENGAEWIQIDEPFLSVGAPMEIARHAVESIALNLKVPVALHVCGKVTPIFEQLLQWNGITMLSHAFMGDDNTELLGLDDLHSSDKMLGLGCVDTKSNRIEDVTEIQKLIALALKNIPEERLAVHPDCGLRLLPREVASEKMRRMVLATQRALEL
ncbi:MAG: methionine synthase [Dehalococcoidia bacterium]|nr:methionine synthase [Dehalococcoidia bacterium]